MKIILAGGTGYLGRMLHHFFLSQGHEVLVLSRRPRACLKKGFVKWDARSMGEWTKVLNGSDAIINLSGQSIKCLFTKKNIEVLKSSRVDATRVIGQAIHQAHHPPKVWIQMSSVTIYSHRVDAPNDELTGRIGEPINIPLVWQKMASLVQEWEQAMYAFPTENTRKTIARISVVMSPGAYTAFDIFFKLARWGLGGTVAGGKAYISWIHEQDFVQVINFLLKNEIKGPVNVTAPGSLPQKEFMAVLRKVLGVTIGLPAARWMMYPLSWLTRVDPELVLKSRFVQPKVLLDHNFKFQFPDWKTAARELIQRKM